MHGMTIALLCAGCAVVRAGASAEPLDDPTRPSSTRSEILSRPKPSELRLEGIIRRNERRIAIVDGRVVHEGERIDNATIEEITANAVRYSRAGHDYTARLTRITLQVRQPSAPQSKLP
jgi:MSHA biogenesis protein MshK